MLSNSIVSFQSMVIRILGLYLSGKHHFELYADGKNFEDIDDSAS